MLGAGAAAQYGESIVCLPVFHVAGTNEGIFALAHGTKTIVHEEVDVSRIIETIARDHVTFIVLVPALILMILEHPAAAGCDFSSLRTLVYGASPIAESVLRRARDLFGHAEFCQMYGMTETTAMGTFSRPEDHDPARGKLRSWKRCRATRRARCSSASFVLPIGRLASGG